MPNYPFNPEYKEKLFQEWWRRGRPGYMVFQNVIDPDDSGTKPHQSTIREWIKEWRKRAAILDEQIQIELEARMVKEKVEMLARHADIGQLITDKALTYLNENDFPTAATALRALTEGIRIERESRGLPDALRKMTLQDDDDLMNSVKKLMEKVQVEDEDED